MFLTALRTTGVADQLNRGGSYTVFAPTDSAIRAMPGDRWLTLTKPESKADLLKFVQDHIARGSLAHKDLVQKTEVETLSGAKLKLFVNNNIISVAGTKLSQAETSCSNGMAHTVESVIVPLKDLVGKLTADGFVTMARVIETADMNDTLSGEWAYTVLAPSEEVFRKIPLEQRVKLLRPEDKDKAIAFVKAHLIFGRLNKNELAAMTELAAVSGAKIRVAAVNGSLTLDGVPVKAPDLAASNGVIHGLDGVLPAGLEILE